MVSKVLRTRARRLCWIALTVATTLVVPVTTAGAQGEPPPWMDTSLSPDERADLLVPRMTLEEKVALMTGDDVLYGQELAYYNAGIPRLGIPDLRMADVGPSVRFLQSPTTAFPMDRPSRPRGIPLLSNRSVKRLPTRRARPGTT